MDWIDPHIQSIQSINITVSGERSSYYTKLNSASRVCIRSRKGALISSHHHYRRDRESLINIIHVHTGTTKYKFHRTDRSDASRWW